MDTPDESQPIQVQIIGEHGLVWSVPDILKLRLEHRLVGCMVGGITGFKAQVSVGGLPLKLSAEEVTLALAAGWVQLYQTCFCIPIGRTAAQQQQQQQQQHEAAAAAANQPPRHKQQQQQSSIHQQQQHAVDAIDFSMRDVEQYDEYYAAYYGLSPATQAQMQQQQKQQQQQQRRQQQQQQRRPVPPWQAAIASGACFELPLTAQQAAAAAAAAAAVEAVPAGANTSSNIDSKQPTALQPVQWGFPQTQQQQLRMAVFADLHSRGYFLTSGSKFGGDFLAYPGDPNLFHAQFVVRVLPLGQVLNPVLFKGLARGVHAARKHLLLASVVDSSCEDTGSLSSAQQQKQQQQQQQKQKQDDCQAYGAAGSGGDTKVVYITVAKEDGFGASK